MNEDPEHTQLIPIADVAAAARVSLRTMTRWKSMGLIVAKRDAGGGNGRGASLTRREAELARLVARLSALGFAMALIRVVVGQLREAGDDSRPLEIHDVILCLEDGKSDARVEVIGGMPLCESARTPA